LDVVCVGLEAVVGNRKDLVVLFQVEVEASRIFPQLRTPLVDETPPATEGDAEQDSSVVNILFSRVKPQMQSKKSCADGTGNPVNAG
jgi:hypothetical protein